MVVAIDRDTVKLGIQAPRVIPVHRAEVYEEIQRANRAAAGEEAPAPVVAGPVPAAPARLRPRRPAPKR